MDSACETFVTFSTKVNNMQSDLGKFILEEAPGGIIATDAHDTVIFWTKGATHIYGYSAEEARGQRLAELIGMPDHPVRQEFGADFAFDSRDKEWVQQVLERTGGKGVDAVIDQVSGALVNQNMQATRVQGRIVNVGP